MPCKVNNVEELAEIIAIALRDLRNADGQRIAGFKSLETVDGFISACLQVANNLVQAGVVTLGNDTGDLVDL